MWAICYTDRFHVSLFSSQSLETSVALSIIKDDEQGKAAAKDGIKIVETALHVIVICEIVVFVVFSLFEVWSKRGKMKRCGTKLAGCLGKICPRRCCFGAIQGRRRTRTRVSSASPSSSSSSRTASVSTSSPPSSRVSAGVEMTLCETKGEEREGTLTATGGSGGLQPAAAVTAAAGGGGGSGMDTVTNPLYGGLRMVRTMTQEARDAAHDALGGVQKNALPGSVVANLSLPCQRASISLDVNPTDGVPEPTAATTASPTTTTTTAPAIVSERNQKEEVDFSEATVSSIGMSHDSFSGSDEDDSAIVMHL